MTPDHPGGEGGESLRRRAVLRGVGATLVAGGLAGCSDVTGRRYEADPVALAPEAGELGYELVEQGWNEYGLSREVAGATVEVTMANHGSAYLGAPLDLGLVATPAVEEGGQQLNPLVEGSPENLLSEDQGRELRRQVDLDDPEGRRPLEEAATAQAELLDGTATTRAFASVTDGVALLVYVARIRHRDDAVFAVATRSRPVVARSEAPVGEGRAYSRAAVEEGLRQFADVLSHVVREEPPELAVVNPFADLDPTPVVEWPVEEGGDGRMRHTAVLETGEEYVLEDPERYRRETERAPEFGDSTGTDAMLTMTPPSEFPDTVSLKDDQSGLRNQGARRTCVVHGIVAAMEAQLNRQGGSVDLSEQYGQHLNKMTYLHASPDGSLSSDNVDDDLLNGFENYFGFQGGSNLKQQLALFHRYGLTYELAVPYRDPGGGYEDAGSPGSDPSLDWTDPSSATQRSVNDYNLADEPTTVDTGNQELEYTPFPRDAVKTARFRIGGYGYLDDTSTAAIEYALAELGREVIVTAKTGSCAAVSDGVWTPGASGSCGYHVVTIVGYDRTQDPSVFVAKNSWNQYSKLSYDYVEEMCTDMAILTDEVEVRGGDEFYPDLFLGRWTLYHDGTVGTLDIRRLPDFFDADALGGEQDMRIGEFYDLEGNLHRVNGEVTEGAHGGEIQFYFDPDDPHTGYDDTGGYAFTGRLAREDTGLIAGTFEADGDEAGFYASKRGNLGGYANDWVSPAAMGGEWTVMSPALEGTLAVTTTASDGSLGGEHYYEEGYYLATTGSLDLATNALEVDLPTPDADWEFSGYVHENSSGTASGFVSTPGGDERYPAVLAREGAATASIRITHPDDGASLSPGMVSLSSTVKEDGQELDDPSVMWTLDEPYATGGEGGTVVGTAAETVAKLGEGTHTIYATYVGGPDARDSVTVSVTGGDAPEVTITSPDDDEFFGPDDVDPDANTPVAEVDLQGTATTASGQALDGDDLEWSYRRNGGAWTDAGTGTSATMEVESGCDGADYDVRLEATDDEGRTGTDVVSIRVTLVIC